MSAAVIVLPPGSGRVRDGVLEDHLIDLPEAVTALRVSPRTVERLAQQGILTRVKVLGATRYRASEIETIIRDGTRPARKGGRR